MVNLHLFTESNTFDIKNSKHVKCWKKSRLSRSKARHQQQQQTLNNFFGIVTNEKSILLYLGCSPHLRCLLRDKLFLRSVLYLFVWKVKKLKIQLYLKRKKRGGGGKISNVSTVYSSTWGVYFREMFFIFDSIFTEFTSPKCNCICFQVFVFLFFF